MLGALGLAMRATAPEAEPDFTPMAKVEDIERLDVWLPHTNDQQLPRVLLIGDSTTRGYYNRVNRAVPCIDGYCLRYAVDTFGND